MQIWYLFLLLVVSVLGGIEADFCYDPEAENGPNEWVNLEVEEGGEANECGGDRQSPIALVQRSSCDERVDYTFSSITGSDCEAALSITRTGVRGDFPDDCLGFYTLELPGGAAVQAKNFHVHVTSEHTIGGTTYDGELHIVHSDEARCLDGTSMVVVALFLEATSATDNAVFGKLLGGWRNIAKQTLLDCDLNDDNDRLEEASYTIYDLVPSHPTFLQYSGSLTTPPCSETVDWHVVEHPVAISASQLAQLQSLISDYYNDETCELATASYNGYNSRTIQSLNGRTVQRICPPRSKVAMMGVFLVGGLMALFLLAIVCRCGTGYSTPSEVDRGKLLTEEEESSRSKMTRQELE